ncbi:MAG: type II secretion system F family protein [Burkholderiaceae bacterium]|nr:type II secretion system F family protein [Burkholderiaceae bacterium]
MTDTTIVLALLFIAVVAGVFGIATVISRQGELRGRLRDVAGGRAAAVEPGSSEWHATILKAAGPVAKLAAPQSEEDLSKFRQRFVQAGFRQPSAPVVFFAAKAALAIGLPLAGMFVMNFTGSKLAGQGPLILLFLLAALGYYLPNAVVARLTQRRQRQLFEAFPDSLDLMIVCVEAGLSLDMAIARAGGEIKLRSPLLAEELGMVGTELRMGASRERALRNLATRTGLDEISSFVAMMVQADRFGTSIADSLRVQADSLRVRRRQRAEEAAAKLPLKLLFPLIFCIFPALLVVLMGPAMIQIYRVLLPRISGGG